MAISYEKTVFKSAVASRLLVLSLIVLWRSIASPYDTSASLNPNCLSSPSQEVHEVFLPWLASAIESSIVWDSVYFVRIAQCGYEYEQSYAFMPLLPVSLSLLSRTVFSPLVQLIGLRAVLALSGYVLNNVAFVLAAIYFYRLSNIVLKDREAAFRASILFCFNPASIFYSSIYSESLYALFSLGGLYHFISGSNNISVILLALSGYARSNGFLNAGYICFQIMHHAVFLKKQAFLAVIPGAFRCIFIFFPFLTFQAYGYYNMCHKRPPNEMRPWCCERVPLLYNYIQSHYWGVGFLRYFQLKQLPNFLLASPVLSLAFCSIVHYVKARPEITLSLGFRASEKEKYLGAMFFSPKTVPVSANVDFLEQSSSRIRENTNNTNLRKRKEAFGKGGPAESPAKYESSKKSGFLSACVLPFIFHLGFMTATAFFVMHVQVATRFLSSSPPLYWFASYLFIFPGSSRRWGFLIWVYCATYILLGSLLFSNFYPFT